MQSNASTNSTAPALGRAARIEERLRSCVPASVQPFVPPAVAIASRTAQSVLGTVQRYTRTPLTLWQRRSWRDRKLEIGPGRTRIPGFETLNIVGGANVDFVCNAQKRLPFRTGTFQVVYASHILEHIPWYHTDKVLSEWVRILAPGGRLEIWVPNGLAIAEAFVAAEQRGSPDFHQDGWYHLNPQQDPCMWAAGRMFSYGDGSGRTGHPNWHVALFSPRHLEQALLKAGCSRVQPLQRSQVRGHDHGWINLGMAGIKA